MTQNMTRKIKKLPTKRLRAVPAVGLEPAVKMLFFCAVYAFT